MDKKHALSALSSQISVDIQSSITKKFTEKTTLYLGNDNKEESVNVQNHLIHTLKAESNNYIFNPTYIQLTSKSGEKHWLAFKDKKEFLEDGDDSNELIFNRLSKEWINIMILAVIPIDTEHY